MAESSERLVGIYSLISVGADVSKHTISMELRRSTLVRMVANDQDQAIAAIASWLDRGKVHLIELGGGWAHEGVARLADLVGDRSIVAVRWFPLGEEPTVPDGPTRRANIFFCSTKGIEEMIETPRDTVWFVGINDPQHGVRECRRLVEEYGVQVIEICSDWGFEGAAQVQAAVGDRVKVGVSLHQALDAAKRAGQLYVPPPFEENDTFSRLAAGKQP